MNMLEIINKIPDTEYFTKQQFRDMVHEINPEYAESSVSWLLSELKKERIITNVGKGVYVQLPEGGAKKIYSFNHLEEYLVIEKMIMQEYPLVTFQMWELNQINEFVNHLFGKNTIFVEVENMLEAPVFNMLHDKFPDVLYCPSTDMYYKHKGNDNTIVVQRLISESPKPMEGHSSPLEKLLVDLFSNKFTGRLISRGEYKAIYEDSFSRYDIDEIKMFRYARRRHLEDKIRRFLQEETGVRLRYS